MTLRKRLFSLAGTLMLAVSPTALVLAQDAQAPTTAVETPVKPPVDDTVKPKKAERQDQHRKAETPDQKKDDAPAATGKEAPAQPAPAVEPRPRKPPAAAGDDASTPAAKPPAPTTGEKNGGQAEPAVKPAPSEPAAPKSVEPKSAEPKPAEPKSAEPKPAEPKPAEPKPAEPKSAEPKSAEPKPAEPKSAEPKPATPKSGETKSGETRPRPPKSAEPPSQETEAPATSPGRQQDADTPPKPRKPRQDVGTPPKDANAPAAPGEGPATDLFRDQRPASQLSDDDLRQRLLESHRRLADPTLSPAQRTTLQRLAQSSRQEFQRRQAGPAGNAARPSAPVVPRNPPPAQSQQGQPPADIDDGTPRAPSGRIAVDPAAEQRAIGLLADDTPLDRMGDQALRQRLGLYRATLAAGDLSPATERGLIERLNAAREALRGRVAEEEDGIPLSGNGRIRARPVPAQPGWDPQFGRPQFHLGSPRPQDIPAILADRRPSAVLTLDQLNRRILVFRDATIDQRYSPEDRDAFAQYLQSDRNELRNRLLSDRGERSGRLQRAENGGRLRLDLDIVPRGGLLPHSIWAAEVDDDQIEQQFAARPLQPLPQRFPRATLLNQPEMVMEQPFVRRAIPSVELDTIHFGFNESFIREEEVAHLDRVGRIIERIVAAHPDEVFVIEGNTDAVGDDAYNLALSKKRAEAVKQSLMQFYLISPRNLVTAGLGERYLKIPTQDPEQENRRVTLRRITPILQD